MTNETYNLNRMAMTGAQFLLAMAPMSGIIHGFQEVMQDIITHGQTQLRGKWVIMSFKQVYLLMWSIRTILILIHTGEHIQFPTPLKSQFQLNMEGEPQSLTITNAIISGLNIILLALQQSVTMEDVMETEKSITVLLIRLGQPVEALRQPTKRIIPHLLLKIMRKLKILEELITPSFQISMHRLRTYPILNSAIILFKAKECIFRLKVQTTQAPGHMIFMLALILCLMRHSLESSPTRQILLSQATTS